jgi:hypothetical protein
VQYTFNLLSGDYKTTYKIGAGPNPENSRVTTANYSLHFPDRWVQDELEVTAGNATGVDILDRAKSGFANNCGRSEDTFKVGAGAMIANKVGPLRAIRSYLGANSGTYTERDQLMYESSTDTVTYLRVHEIPPLRDWYDYNPAANGMTFQADNMSGSVPIDGTPDTVPISAPQWQLVTGAQGSVVNTYTLQTNIANAASNVQQYYSDDTTPSEVQCTGDAFEYGASGTQFNMTVPCTDPTLGCTSAMTSTRHTEYLAPGASAADAAAFARQTTNPVTVTTASFAP